MTIEDDLDGMERRLRRERNVLAGALEAIKALNPRTCGDVRRIAGGAFGTLCEEGTYGFGGPLADFDGQSAWDEFAREVWGLGYPPEGWNPQGNDDVLAPDYCENLIYADRQEVVILRSHWDDAELRNDSTWSIEKWDGFIESRKDASRVPVSQGKPDMPVQLQPDNTCPTFSALMARPHAPDAVAVLVVSPKAWVAFDVPYGAMADARRAFSNRLKPELVALLRQEPGLLAEGETIEAILPECVRSYAYELLASGEWAKDRNQSGILSTVILQIVEYILTSEMRTIAQVRGVHLTMRVDDDGYLLTDTEYALRDGGSRTAAIIDGNHRGEAMRRWLH